MSKIRVTQKRSVIDQTKRQKRTMIALGLRKINHAVEHNDTPQIKGMVEKVKHLVNVEYLN